MQYRYQYTNIDRAGYSYISLSMCTLLVEHVHTYSWAYSHFQLSHACNGADLPAELRGAPQADNGKGGAWIKGNIHPTMAEIRHFQIHQIHQRIMVNIRHGWRILVIIHTLNQSYSVLKVFQSPRMHRYDCAIASLVSNIIQMKAAAQTKDTEETRHLHPLVAIIIQQAI